MNLRENRFFILKNETLKTNTNDFFFIKTQVFHCVSSNTQLRIVTFNKVNAYVNFKRKKNNLIFILFHCESFYNSNYKIRYAICTKPHQDKIDCRRVRTKKLSIFISCRPKFTTSSFFLFPLVWMSSISISLESWALSELKSKY